MNKLKLKLIAYWNQYKMVLKYVPIEQEYIITETHHIDRADDGSIGCESYKYTRCKIDQFHLDLRGIKRINMTRESAELYDYLIWKRRKMGY